MRDHGPKVAKKVSCSQFHTMQEPSHSLVQIYAPVYRLEQRLVWNIVSRDVMD